MLEPYQARLATPFAVLGIRADHGTLDGIEYLPTGSATLAPLNGTADKVCRQIERYLEREQPFDCAGSFKAEGLGIALFESMHGDDPNALIGLPLIRLVTLLQQAGISVI